MSGNKEELRNTNDTQQGHAVEEQENIVVRIQQYVEKNGTKIMVLAVAIIVVTAAIFYIKGNMEESALEDKNRAMVSLDRLNGYITSGDTKKALYGDSTRTVRGEEVIGLIELVNRYEGIKLGKLAAMYAGNAYLAESDYDNAIKYFEKAAGSASKVVQLGANAGLGASYEGKGNNSEASKYYERASELSDSKLVEMRYKYFVGLNNEKSGNKTDAEKIYREIIAENEYSEFADLSKAGLIRLGTIIE